MLRPRYTLTFTFLEKHVSLNYNPCWYQNVCSLNIYQPRVTSKSLNTGTLRLPFLFFFLPKCCVPKEMQWKHYRLSQVSKLRRRNALLPTPQTRLRERKRKKYLPPTNQRCFKIRVAETSERVQMWRSDKKKPCKYWHCDSPSPALIRRTFPVGAIKHLLGTVTGARAQGTHRWDSLSGVRYSETGGFEESALSLLKDVGGSESPGFWWMLKERAANVSALIFVDWMTISSRALELP